jgi:hypothetical protein
VIVVFDCLDDILLILFIFSDALEQSGQKIKTYYCYTFVYLSRLLEQAEKVADDTFGDVLSAPQIEQILAANFEPFISPWQPNCEYQRLADLGPLHKLALITFFPVLLSTSLAHSISAEVFIESRLRRDLLIFDQPL